MKTFFDQLSKTRVTILATVFVLAAYTSFAQQDPAYSFFMYNGLAVNPAVAGSAETFSATSIYRKQWAGIKGAPETITLNADAPIRNKKIALGLSIISDKLGVMNNTNVNAQYAYRLQFKKGVLSFGLQAGLNSFKADYTSVDTNPNQGTDNSFAQNTSKVVFNFGSGVYYYTKQLYAGFSVPHFINQQLDNVSETGVQARQYRHYYFTTGYVFSAGKDFKIKPSTLVKIAEGAPVQIDINSNFWYKDMACVGFSLRTNDSFTTLLQFQYKEFRLGYAHDFITSSLSRYTSSNNEVMLRYELPRKKDKVLTPRYY
jgi:type IX secretion system PorP/SprF family membrane protein